MKPVRQHRRKPSSSKAASRPARGDDALAISVASLRDSEARLSAILRTAVEGILTIDSHGIIESANPAALRIFGYAIEELVGRNVSILMPPPEASRHDNHLARYLRTGRAKIIGIGREVVGRRKDGSLLPLDLAVSEVHISGQRMFTGFIRDISDRKRTEAGQQLQQAITETLADSTSVSDATLGVLKMVCLRLNWDRGELWNHDREAGVLRFIRSWQRSGRKFRALEILSHNLTIPPGRGFSGDVLATGRPAWTPDVVRDPAFGRNEAVLTEGLQAAVAFPVLLNGEVQAVMTFLGREIRLPDEHLLQVLQTIGGLLGQFMERKRAEDSARREQAFASAIVATSSALVVVLDRERRIVQFNPACERITGYKLKEVRHRHLAELFLPPEERDAVMRVFSSLVSGKIPNRHEHHWLTRRGERRWIAWSNSVLLDSNGKVEYVISTGIDLTDQKRLEREILGISEMERRSIGHDLHDGLCQQLAGVEFMSEALAQRLKAESPANANYAGQIASLVRQSIAQTRGLAHGLSPVMKEAAGLMSALEALADNTSRVFGVNCRFLCPRPVLVHHDAAATHAYRIIQEAVSNALRHGRASRITIRLEAARHHATLTVRDNGVGFFLPNAVASGMGLAIMRYRATMIGGKVDVHARPGKGTTIVCSFPVSANDSIRQQSTP